MKILLKTQQLLKQLHKYSKRTFIKSDLCNFWRKNNVDSCNVVAAGKVSPERLVPLEIPKPPYYYKFMDPGDTSGIPEIKNREQILRMRESCALAANVLESCADLVKVGVTTDEIDAFVHDKIISLKAYPSPLRYAGFPKSVCTSVNNVACHGIPDDRKLLNGDIINIDITLFYKYYHGDCSKTFLVGNVDEIGKYLVKSTEECLYGAIQQCGPEKEFCNIGQFIDSFAIEHKLTIVPVFIGHGIGSYFHGPPEILHYYNNLPGKMKSGMTFTIEPILSLGGPQIQILEDNWTAVTTDKARSAQFEHTVLITESGVDILTLPEKNKLKQVSE